MFGIIKHHFHMSSWLLRYRSRSVPYSTKPCQSLVTLQKTSVEKCINESCLVAVDECFWNIDSMYLNLLHLPSLLFIHLDLNPQDFLAPDVPVFLLTLCELPNWHNEKTESRGRGFRHSSFVFGGLGLKSRPGG
jgi:hypothetical protein